MDTPNEYRDHSSRLAVGIIVKDEQDRLAATLASLRPLSDLIYVLDTGSTDETISLAKSFGVNVSTATFNGDFSAVRNELIQIVEADNRADWLLWINAGERFDAATVEEFQDFFSDSLEPDAAYMMVLHRPGGPTDSKHDLDEETIDLRLMPLRKGLQFTGVLNESLFSFASSLMLRMSALPGRILCPSKSVDAERWQRRALRNMYILADLERQGVPIADDYLLLRAEALAVLGEHAVARCDYLQLIEETDQTNLRLEAMYGLWATFTPSPIEPNEMTKALLVGMNLFPVDTQLLTFMGSHMQKIGRLDLAVRTFETAVKYGQISLDVWHRVHIREQAVLSLGLVHRLQGNGREAMRVMESNLDLIEDRESFGRHLLDLYIVELQESKAHDFAATLWGGEKLDQLREVLTGACRATAGAWSAAAIPLESAYLSGCRDVLCLRWYALTLLALAKFSQAIRILEEWLAIDPTNSEASAFHFAASQPERFNEIMDQIHRTQMQALGIAPSPLHEPKTEKTRQPDNSDAVREMIVSSGIASEKIGIPTSLGVRLKTGGFDADTFELEPSGGNSGLVFHPNS